MGVIRVMQIVVFANGIQKAELGISHREEIVWAEEDKDFLRYPSADAFVDLQYLNTPERNTFLSGLHPGLVVVNSVTDTLQETDPSFVRINGWTTFLSSPVIEAACNNKERKEKAEAVFSLFQKKLQWLPDNPGFITARVVSMIVNEAYLSLGEGVSTEEEINTAMKLGTAHPYGPFEWGKKIGLQNIVTLLQTLSKTQRRYTPAELLVQETDRAI